MKELKLNVNEIKNELKNENCVRLVLDNIGWSESCYIGKYKNNYVFVSEDCKFNEDGILYLYKDLNDLLELINIEEGYEFEIYKNEKLLNMINEYKKEYENMYNEKVEEIDY